MAEITDVLIKIAKFSAIVVISAVFMVALNALLGMIGQFSSTTIIGEFFSLISMYLPFDASTIFNSILAVCIGVLSFLVANKIFNLTSWSINSV